MAIPQIDIIQIDNATDPSGTRELGAGVDGFVKFLDTSTSGELDFGGINISTSGSYAGTKLLYLRTLDMGDASTIFNFKFWLVSVSSWGTGAYSFKWRNQIGFTSGVGLIDGDSAVPLTLPSAQNVLSTQSGTYIQTVAESGCTEYIYVDVKADTDVPVGNYGGPGNGGFRYRFTYDFA